MSSKNTQERLLIGPFSQVLTLRNLPKSGAINDQQLEIISEAGVLIQNGKICAIDSWHKLQKQADHLQELQGPLTLTPGLIDAHTHLCFAGTRARDYSDRLNGMSYQEIAARGGGIKDTMYATRQASEQELCTLNLARLARHLKSGITTVEIKSGYGLSVDQELKMLRVIQNMKKHTPQRLISTCLAAHVPPPEFTDPSAYLEHLSVELLPRIQSENLCQRIDAFIEPNAFPATLALPYLKHAQSLGFELSLHADQFERGGALLAAELGAKSADHLEASHRVDLEALAQAQVSAIALPGASLGLGCGYTPARLALDVGCSLAIASDWNPGSAPMGDLLLQASVLGAAERLSAAEVWAGMTLRAANALGLSHIGSLDLGYHADLLAFPCSDYREILYHQGMLRPSHVWCQGIEVVCP